VPGKIIAVVDRLSATCVTSARSRITEACVPGIAGVKLIACLPEHYAARRWLEHTHRDGSVQTTWRDALRQLELAPQTLDEIRRAAPGLEMIVAPYDVASFARLADQPVDVWQIDGVCVTNIPLIQAIAARARAVYLGTWGCAANEIEQAVSLLKNNNLVLMHSLRSSQNWVKDLATLRWLRKFGFPLGCSVEGSEQSLVGLALDLPVIQIPLGRVDAEAFPLAHVASQVVAIEEITRSGPEFIYLPEEMDELEDVRVGLVAARSIRQGAVLTAEMLACKAPAVGVAPALLSTLIGKRVRFDLEPDDPITFGVIGE
jgi:sialic acid synthase SpsE